jgi:hypothetical protein
MTEYKAVNINQQNTFVKKSDKGYGLSYFAKRDFKKGQIVMCGYGMIIDHQTPHFSVQISINRYYLPKKNTGRYWNHSCNPNTFVKTRSDGFPNLISARKIIKGEEITFAYYMTELLWSKQADENIAKCHCGSKQCRGKIFSFSQLSKNEQDELAKTNRISKYLKEYWRQRKSIKL